MVEFLRLSRQRQRRFRVFRFFGKIRGDVVDDVRFPLSAVADAQGRSRFPRTSHARTFVDGTLFFFFTPSSYTQRVYYVREDIMKRATSVARDQLVSLGVCVGKFTHSDKFRLTIGALELLAAHAKHKVRIATGEADASRSFALFFRRYARRMRLVRSSRRCFSFAFFLRRVRLVAR